MPSLSITDKLQPGLRYTFHFITQSAIVRDGAITDALTVAYSFVSDVTETRQLFGNDFTVSFRWTGLPTAVGDVAGNILQILGPIVSPIFLSAEGGDVPADGSATAIYNSVADPIGNVSKGIFDTVGGFFSGLKTTAISLLIGIAAIIILVLILAAYGPNVKHIAGALS